MWRFTVLLLVSLLAIYPDDVRCNFLTNAAFDGVISAFRSSLDPLELADAKYDIKYRLLFTFSFGSIELTKTNITGLANLTRVGDIDVDFDADGISGWVHLGVPNVRIKSVVKPSIGGLIQVGYPIPMLAKIDYMEAKFKITMDSFGGNPQVDKLIIEKFDNLQIHFDYGMLINPVGRLVNRILNESVVKLLNSRIKNRLAASMKTRMNENLKSYSVLSLF